MRRWWPARTPPAREKVRTVGGIKPGYEGLEIDPCIPAGWKGFRIRRRYRGAEYDIRISNPAGVCRGVKSLTVDGATVAGNVVPLQKGGTHAVEVTLG